MTIRNNKGFTLVELLIVIAILGTLAVVVLIALNPVQQLARTRDAGRLSTITQLGHTMQALATGRNGVYPTNGGAGDCEYGETSGAAWIDNCLVTAGELNSLPVNPSYSALAGSAFPGCGVSATAQGDWCYRSTASSAAIYTRPESNSNINICPGGSTAWLLYSTTAGKGGVWCGGADPGAAITGADTGWID